MILGRPSRTVISAESLSLLAGVAPTFRACAPAAGRGARARRLELRANVVLVVRERAELSVKSVERAIELTGARAPRIARRKTVALGRDAFTFSTEASAAAFRDAAEAAMAAHSAAPAYVVVARLGRDAAGAPTHVARAWDPSGDGGSHSCLIAVKSIPKPPHVHYSHTHAHAHSHSHALTATSAGSAMDERVALQRAVRSRSPFLPRALHAFETPSAFHLATDATPLATLDRLLQRLPCRRVPPVAARAVFAELLLALEDVHALGVLHCDVRPQRVQLSATGHVRLADFALAKSAPKVTDKPPRACSFALGFGSHPYMAPERLQAASPGGYATYGPASDVWALGAMLFEMITGRQLSIAPAATAATPYTYNFDTHDDDNKHDDDADDDYSDYCYNDDDDDDDDEDYDDVDDGDDDTLIGYTAAYKLAPPFTSPSPCEEKSSLRALLCALLAPDEGARPTLAKVRGMAWLRGVDWVRVRQRAAEDVPVDSVLTLIAAAGVSGVTDCVRPMLPIHAAPDAECARLTREFACVDARPMRRRGAFRRKASAPRLLGFAYNMRGERRQTPVAADVPRSATCQLRFEPVLKPPFPSASPRSRGLM